jgi:GTP cyclohydrolase I
VEGKADALPSARVLIEAVETCGSSELYSVLKRPDEKQVTERAYDNPVFVEDLVRNVALKIQDMKGVNSYCIEGENFESIHNHNAFAIVVSG